jgi:mannosyltransferase
VRIALVLFGIFVLGTFLRLYQIGSKSIWLDEAFSIYMSAKPVSEMLGLIVDIEKHPPLYYLLLHFWMRIGGDSAAWVRSLSAIFGILTIPIIFLAGRRLAGNGIGLLAALILAINPLQIAFAQETRVYTLLTFTVTFTIWMVARLLTDVRSSRQMIGAGIYRLFRHGLAGPGFFTDLTWLGYSIGTAIVMYLHNTGFFFPLAVNLFVFALMLYARFSRSAGNHFSPPSLVNWVLAQIGAFILWSPWIWPLIQQSRDLAESFWLPIPNWSIIVETIQSLLLDYLPPSSWVSYGWLLMLVLGILGAVYLRRNGYVVAFLLTLFLVPILGQLLVSMRVPIFYVRALIWVPVPFFILAAAGLLQLRKRWLITAATFVLVYFNLTAAFNYYQYIEKERWDLAAEYVAQNLQENDIIVFNAGWVQIPFDYYFDDYALQVGKFGAPASMFEMGQLEPIMHEDDIPRLRGIIESRERIWLVYSHNWYTDPQGLVPATIGETYRLLDKREFFQVQVFLFGGE